jgi:hypothetical protein
MWRKRDGVLCRHPQKKRVPSPGGPGWTDEDDFRPVVPDLEQNLLKNDPGRECVHELFVPKEAESVDPPSCWVRKWGHKLGQLIIVMGGKKVHLGNPPSPPQRFQH